MADKRAGKSSTQRKPAAKPQEKKGELSEAELKKVTGGGQTIGRTGKF